MACVDSREREKKNQSETRRTTEKRQGIGLAVLCAQSIDPATTGEGGGRKRSYWSSCSTSCTASESTKHQMRPYRQRAIGDAL